MKINGALLVTRCIHCGEEVRLNLTRKQIKALAKSLKMPSKADAERIIEKSICF